MQSLVTSLGLIMWQMRSALWQGSKSSISSVSVWGDYRLLCLHNASSLKLGFKWVYILCIQVY